MGGGGEGESTENLTFFSFQMSVSPPLGLHFKSNSHPCSKLTCASLGLMPVGSSPPILGQTIDRCIRTPINGLPRMVEGGGGRLGRTHENRWLDDVDLPFLSLFALLKLVIRRRKPRKNLFEKQDVV